ncbi:uncharacterized protein LOC114319107 [Camellia sinensis]|uniref:uncharacterized protein LOC114319107 n=1 Tax=Camellia sinensis TaxID=4442 RepID=UPI001035BDF2|nr:uncharacterized protein LOC114319107 [Camellia sinensis]
MKELGFINYFLGISVTSSPTGFFLNQAKYATEILMLNCKAYASPMAIKSSLSSHSDVDFPFDNPSLYRSLVGALQYLTITHPDLAFAVNSACQHMQCPLFSPGPLVLHAYSDSDWAGNTVDHRSTTGFCVSLGLNLISWSAKKHPTVSWSSSEAEYRALAQTAAELSLLAMLLTDLHVSFPTPTLWCDNLSAIAMTTNPVFHARSKHIEVVHYVRDF